LLPIFNTILTTVSVEQTADERRSRVAIATGAYEGARREFAIAAARMHEFLIGDATSSCSVAGAIATRH